MKRLYEDENLEKQIYDIVSNENNPIEVIRQNNQYKYHYFLSPLRHGLLEWYPFEKEGSLLEIGSGYGQLTSLFTQKVNRVVAVEDSKSKCDIISKRAEDAIVMLSDFDDIQLDEKFDYIILCNVFEYAKSFFKSKNPYVDYLNYLKKFLKEGGVILLALSNRLGLKYFAGAKEEHANQFFYGLNGFNDTDIVQTFSKTELEDIINAAGFSKYKFFYPYPNHEIPQVINTDKTVNKIPFMGVTEFPDDRIQVFEEEIMNMTLSQDDLCQYFANSFLVEIRSSDMRYPTDDIDFIKLALNKKKEFQVTTTIWSDGTVSKSPVCPQAENHIKEMYDASKYGMGRIKCLNAEMKDGAIYYDFLKQGSFENMIVDAAIDNDKERFFKLIEDYYDALFYNSFESNEYSSEEFLNVFKVKSDITFHCHERSFVDLNLGNLFIIDGEFTMIDYEWPFDFQIPLEYIFYETFRYYFYSNERVREFTSYEEIFNHFNLDIENIGLFEEWYCNYLRYFLNRPPITHPKIISLETLTGEDLNDIDLKNKEIKKMRRKIKMKNKEIKKMQKEIEKNNKKIETILNSNSWKITKPLRKLKSISKKLRF